MFTGWRPSPAVQYPSIGSIVSHELGSRNDLPPYVCISSQPNAFAGTGFLGSAYGPFSLGADPGNGGFIYQRFQRGIMHFDNATGVTRGILLADYFKGLVVGHLRHSVETDSERHIGVASGRSLNLAGQPTNRTMTAKNPAGHSHARRA